MQQVDAVILDLGNVLVFHDNALLARRLAERAGVAPEVAARMLADPSTSQPINRGALDGEGIRRAVCRALGTEIDMVEFAPLWSCHFTVHEAVLPLVDSLVGRVKLVLLSNTNALHTAFIRPRVPLLERFDHLLFSNEVGMIKPEAAFYQLALARAGVEGARAAFFDDHRPFVEAAAALGINAYQFSDAEDFARRLANLGL